MPPAEKVPSSALVRRSRELRKRAHSEQEESLRLTAAGHLRSPEKSLELCRHSEELLRRSRQLCERLRKLRHAP
jgi:hypothetical protein